MDIEDPNRNAESRWKAAPLLATVFFGTVSAIALVYFHEAYPNNTVANFLWKLLWLVGIPLVIVITYRKISENKRRRSIK